jgi:2-methylaconitate cis-trans-isomerase PrpF
MSENTYEKLDESTMQVVSPTVESVKLDDLLNQEESLQGIIENNQNELSRVQEIIAKAREMGIVSEKETLLNSVSIPKVTKIGQ